MTTHQIRATVQGPGFMLRVVSPKSSLTHGFDAVNLVINEIANEMSMTAAEVLEHFQIIHMSVIRM